MISGFTVILCGILALAFSALLLFKPSALKKDQ